MLYDISCMDDAFQINRKHDWSINEHYVCGLRNLWKYHIVTKLLKDLTVLMQYFTQINEGKPVRSTLESWFCFIFVFWCDAMFNLWKRLQHLVEVLRNMRLLFGPGDIEQMFNQAYATYITSTYYYWKAGR